MTQKEKMETFTPRKCENQIEFEDVIMKINDEQEKENSPYKEQLLRVNMVSLDTQNEIHRLNIRLNELKQQKLRIESDLKEINRRYHDMKHSWIALNPREGFVNTKAE